MLRKATAFMFMLVHFRDASGAAGVDIANTIAGAPGSCAAPPASLLQRKSDQRTARAITATLSKEWFKLADVESNNASVCLAIPIVPEDFRMFNEVTLPSIQSQTNLPSELVIAMSSATPAEARKLKSDLKGKLPGIGHIEVSLKEGKAFAGENRNRAARKCSKDLVVFADADDGMHPRRLEILASVFQRERPKVMLSGFSRGVLPIPELESTFSIIKGDVLSQQGRSLLARQPHSVHQGQPAVAKSVFEQVHQKKGLAWGEDVRFLDEVMVRFGNHKDTMLYVGLPLIQFGHWKTGR